MIMNQVTKAYSRHRAALDLFPTIDGVQYAMRVVTDDEAYARKVAADFESQQHQVRSVAGPSPNGGHVTWVASRPRQPDHVRARIPHDHAPAWEYARIAISAFREIVRRQQIEPTWWKDLEPSRLSEAGSSINWQGSVGEVAADFLTAGLTHHGLPNLNHRTHLMVARLYLAFQGVTWPHYSLRGRGVARFGNEMNDYVLESKYLIHLYRQKGLLAQAHELGYNGIAISDGQFHDLHAEDLQQRERDFKRRHREESGKFIARLDDGAAAAQLLEQSKGGLSDFTKWARAES